MATSQAAQALRGQVLTEEPRRIRLTSIERVPKQTESESDKFIGEYSVVTSPSTSEVNSPPVRSSSTGRHSRNFVPGSAALPAEVSHQVQSSVGGQRHSETVKSEVWNVNGPADTRRSTHATVLPSESEDTECSALPRLLGSQQQGDAAPLPSPRGSEMEGGVSVDKRSTVVNTWEASSANAVMDAPDPYSSRVSESKRISALSMNGQEQRGSRSRASEVKAGQRDSTFAQMDVSEHTSRRVWEDPRSHVSNARSVRSMPAEQDMTSEQEYYASVPDATREQPARQSSRSRSQSQPRQSSAQDLHRSSRGDGRPQETPSEAEYYSLCSRTSAKGQSLGQGQETPSEAEYNSHCSHPSSKGQTSSRRESHAPQSRSRSQLQLQETPSEAEYYSQQRPSHTSAKAQTSNSSRRESHVPQTQSQSQSHSHSRSQSHSPLPETPSDTEYHSQQRPSHTSAKAQPSTSSRRESHAPQPQSRSKSQSPLPGGTPSEAEFCSQQRPSHTSAKAQTSTSSRPQRSQSPLQETPSEAEYCSQQRPSHTSTSSRPQRSQSQLQETPSEAEYYSQQRPSHTSTKAQTSTSGRPQSHSRSQSQLQETPSEAEYSSYSQQRPSHTSAKGQTPIPTSSRRESHAPQTQSQLQETPSEAEYEYCSQQRPSHSQTATKGRVPPSTPASRRESHVPQVQETASDAEHHQSQQRPSVQSQSSRRQRSSSHTTQVHASETPSPSEDDHYTHGHSHNHNRSQSQQQQHSQQHSPRASLKNQETPSEPELERASHQQQHDRSRSHSHSHSQSHHQSQSPPRVTSTSSRRESHAVQETPSEAEYYSLCSRTNTLANAQQSVEPHRSAHERTVAPLLEASHVHNSRCRRDVVCEDETPPAVELHSQRKASVRGSQSQAQVQVPVDPIPMCFEDECDEVLHKGVEEGRNSKAVRFSRRQEEVHKSMEAIPVELLDSPRVFEHNSDSEAEEEEKLPRDTYGSKGINRRPTPYPRHHEQPRSLSQDVESSSRGQQDSSRQLEHGYRRADCRFTSEACPLYVGVSPEPASPITFADAPPVPLCGGERARVQLLLESAHEVVEAILAPRCARESAALELPRVLQDLSASFALHARALLESPGNPPGLDGVPAVLSLLVRLVEALDVLIAPEEETTQRGRMSRGGEAADLVSGRGCRSVDATEALQAGLGPRGFLPVCLRLLGEGDVAAKLRASGAHELAQELTLHAALALRLGLAWVPPPGCRRPCEALLSAKGHEKLVGAAGCGLGRLGAQEEDLSAGLGRLGLVLDCLRLGLRSDMCVDKLLRGKDCTGRSSRCDDCRTPVGRDKKTETQICNPVAPLAPLAVEALEQTATLKAESTAALSAATASVRLLAVLVDLPVDAGPSPPNRIACALKKLFHGQPFHPPLTSAVRQLVCCRRNSRGWFGDQGKHFSKSLRSALAAENVTGECVHAALRALGEGHFQRQPSRDGAPQSVRAEAAACGRRYILLASLYENVEAIACAVHGPGAVSEEDLTELRSLCDGERSSEGAPPPPRRSLRSNLGNLRGKIRETCLAPYIR